MRCRANGASDDTMAPPLPLFGHRPVAQRRSNPVIAYASNASDFRSKDDLHALDFHTGKRHAIRSRVTTIRPRLRGTLRRAAPSVSREAPTASQCRPGTALYSASWRSARQSRGYGKPARSAQAPRGGGTAVCGVVRFGLLITVRHDDHRAAYDDKSDYAAMLRSVLFRIPEMSARKASCRVGLVVSRESAQSEHSRRRSRSRMPPSAGGAANDLQHGLPHCPQRTRYLRLEFAIVNQTPARQSHTA